MAEERAPDSCKGLFPLLLFRLREAGRRFGTALGLHRGWMAWWLCTPADNRSHMPVGRGSDRCGGAEA
jgi:hypothetical protein